MKKRWLAATFLLFTSQAIAGDLFYKAGGGIVFPVGFTNLGPGMALQAGAGVVFSPIFSGTAVLERHTFLLDDPIVKGAGDGQVSYSLGINTEANIISLPPVRWYLLAGLGVDFLSGTVGYTAVGQYAVNVSETFLEVQLGGGLSFELDPNLSLFLEAKDHLLLTQGGGRFFVPITFGLKITP